MDKQIFEIIGKMFIQAAKNQEQFDKFSEWMRSIFQATESSVKKSDAELMSNMKKMYAMGSDTSEQSNTEALDQLSKNFQQSMDTLMNMSGCVSKSSHLELIEKYENLKKVCAEKDETIKNLRILLNEKTAGVSQTMNDLQEIIQKQTQQFMSFIAPFTDKTE